MGRLLFVAGLVVVGMAACSADAPEAKPLSAGEVRDDAADNPAETSGAVPPETVEVPVPIVEGNGDPTSPGTPTSPAADGGAPSTDAGTPAPAPLCVAGQTYCGATTIGGTRGSLYRCGADGRTRALVMKCGSSCTTNQPAAQDACARPVKCVVGGTYCGGDKVNGNPNVLYKCTGTGFTASVHTRCANGCFVAPAGTDDRCR